MLLQLLPGATMWTGYQGPAELTRRRGIVDRAGPIEAMKAGLPAVLAHAIAHY
jgi:hypothetical protein